MQKNVNIIVILLELSFLRLDKIDRGDSIITKLVYINMGNKEPIKENEVIVDGKNCKNKVDRYASIKRIFQFIEEASFCGFKLTIFSNLIAVILYFTDLFPTFFHYMTYANFTVWCICSLIQFISEFRDSLTTWFITIPTIIMLVISGLLPYQYMTTFMLSLLVYTVILFWLLYKLKKTPIKFHHN